MISNVTNAVVSTEAFDAIVFDLDGVITQTATVHSQAWKTLFDDVIRKHAQFAGEEFEPFTDADYLNYVDGKPRYEGVKAFLESRNISLPFGDPSDPPSSETVCGLGNRKNKLFLEHLESHGVEVFLSSVALLIDAREKQLKTAIISSSKNCEAVLKAAGLTELFDVRIDGSDLAPRGLAGKPKPDMFLAAAEELGVSPDRTVVIEDAISGVQAGRAGNFALVIGVDRSGQRASLLSHGADVVVNDLEEVLVTNPTFSDQLPSALESFDEIAQRIDALQVVLFLDYDGTLTPIVASPEQAVLSAAMRDLVESLTQRATVVIVSGRDREDVRRRVDLANAYYIGSHGYDISGPEGSALHVEFGESFLPALDDAQRDLEAALKSIPGATVERKRYSIAVHYRLVAEGDVPAVAGHVDAALSEHAVLKRGEGKKVFELQPDMDWHKGAAVQWLLDELGVDEEDAAAMYIGDDVTDENAFNAMGDEGISIVVAQSPKVTAAQYVLADTNAVAEFLQALGGVLAELHR